MSYSFVLYLRFRGAEQGHQRVTTIYKRKEADRCRVELSRLNQPNLLPPLEILGLALKPLELTLLPDPDPLRGPPVPPALLRAHTHNTGVDSAADAVLQLGVQLRELVGC